MHSKVYISLSGIFFAASVMMYGIGVFFIDDLTPHQYFNVDAICRAMFALSFTYAIFEIEYWQKRSIRVWALKYASIYATGFLTTRAAFNCFVNDKITVAEIVIMAMGAIITIILSIKIRNDNS